MQSEAIYIHKYAMKGEKCQINTYKDDDALTIIFFF